MRGEDGCEVGSSSSMSRYLFRFSWRGERKGGGEMDRMGSYVGDGLVGGFGYGYVDEGDWLEVEAEKGERGTGIWGSYLVWGEGMGKEASRERKRIYKWESNGEEIIEYTLSTNPEIRILTIPCNKPPSKDQTDQQNSQNRLASGNMGPFLSSLLEN